MSDTKHTPGPWHALPARTGFYVQSENDIIVDTADQNARYGTIDNEANANLIAAAPELLVALEAVEIAATMGFASAEILRHDSAIRKGIRAAIAKAKGEQP